MSHQAIHHAQRFLAVAAESAKIIYSKQHLSPPTLSKWTDARHELVQGWKTVRSKHVADFTPAQVGSVTLLALEVAGFFCIGEIIARGQVIGYKY